jgi:hypothetical protein
MTVPEVSMIEPLKNGIVAFEGPGKERMQFRSENRTPEHKPRLVEDSVNLSGKRPEEKQVYEKSDLKTETPKKADPSEYHFQPQFKVEQVGKGWVMHLPNAKVTIPRKPEWLTTIEQMNEILDEAKNPPEVRKTVDDIKKIADKSYESTTLNFDRLRLDSYVSKIDDPDTIGQTKKIFSLLLDNEMKSTHQVGGAMAGSRCSEMHKYGNIMDALDKKISGKL